MEQDKQILEAAFRAWNDAAEFRGKRHRYKQFTYGNQWGDIVTDGRKTMTAAERAISHGRRPMTNNLLRRLVKSVIGRYRYQRQEAKQPTGEKGEVFARNNLDELDCRALEEFLISGCTVQRVCRERRLQGEGMWVDIVSPDKFFVNKINDPRGWDAELVGMLHDWSITETVLRLAGPDRARADMIRRVYSELSDVTPAPLSGLTDGGESFLTAPAGRCRVIEVWTLEAGELLRCHDTARATYFTVPATESERLDTINRERRKRGELPIESKWEAATTWRCRWMSPDGRVLHSHLSTAADGRHPFQFRFYPMIDGEIHSLVEDVIDQQIYINELISLIDHVVSCAAKGVLVFPAEEKIPEMTWEQIAQMWSSPDAIIPVKGRSARPPQQITASTSNLAASELLTTQMQMFEDVSGVANALMGRSQGGNIGVEHYESQVKNAIIAIADILDTFGNFISERNNRL